MLKPFLIPLLCCLTCALVIDAAHAQSADSLDHTRAAYANVETNFYKAIGSKSRLYDGPEYTFYNPAIKGNAYFMDDFSWEPGSVDYDGYQYKNITLLYDMYKDQVVVLVYKSYLTFSLLPDKVKSFDLLDHHFVHIKKDTLNSTSVRSGYYDQLYGGKIQVLARRTKSIQATTTVVSIENYFLPAVDYYIYKNGNYYSVGSQGSFLDVLKDKKKDLQRFIRSNNIKYRKNREDAMAKIAAYYDHLTD
jgi:hypothetical protein